MATEARNHGGGASRWLRPLVPILAVLGASIVFLFIGSAVAVSQSSEAAPFDPLRALPYLVIGGALTYGVAVLASGEGVWRVGTREVVFMAIGAALYGVLSWATNIIPMPSVSLVSLRPGIVIPIFFGVVFGPAVGFFTGFVGNVLGDALTGWGVFPIWDLGNGLIGLVSGLAVSFRERPRLANILLGVVIAVNLLITALLLLYPETGNQLGSGAVGGAWWLPLVVVALAAGGWALLRRSTELVSAQLWGALGVIVGCGFAAIADIWWNGYTPITALLGEFFPSAIPNLIHGLILLPILLSAWESARARSGR
ncbi:MAG TPA: ECF transporter S component [Roseiflexaceae bacterium]|nr:ECF transporter S component [Roseiflexaceae bacterium]